MGSAKGDGSRRRRSVSRLHAVQALFQMEQSDQDAEQVEREFVEHRFGEIQDGVAYAKGDKAFFSRILKGAVLRQSDIDQMADRALPENWPIDRIDPILRALFRAAGAELLRMRTPPKAVISEYVDVAKAFFPDGKESGFANGVLDHIAREAKPESFEDSQ